LTCVVTIPHDFATCLSYSITIELDLPASKKIHIAERWEKYAASDGKVVELPPPLMEILASTEFVPEPRAAFGHLKANLAAGDAIIIPSMGQHPKEYVSRGKDAKLFVTEQMLALWEDKRGDQKRTYRRVLAGPMSVGKSYLSYFLAAKAYAEGWLVLYLSDAGMLDQNKQDESALELVSRFLAINKDILTGAELEILVRDYKGGTDYTTTDAVSIVFRRLLMSRERKTLLLVDQHGKLFEKEPYLPDKFEFLVPLKSYGWWGEDAKGSRMIFTGTSYAKYEMKIMD